LEKETEKKKKKKVSQLFQRNPMDNRMFMGLKSFGFYLICLGRRLSKGPLRESRRESTGKRLFLFKIKKADKFYPP
jgi:hypothetical protein